MERHKEKSRRREERGGKRRGGERRGQERRERERRGEEKEPVDAYITCLYQADPMFLTNSHSYINKSNKPNKINSKEINTYITE